MISLLSQIVSNIICWIETALIDIANVVIVVLANVIKYVVLLLPDMPSLPAMPSQITQAIQWGNYYFPLGFMLTMFTTVAGLWFAWIVIRIPLRWGKANPT